jgi:hypothetical protein
VANPHDFADNPTPLTPEERARRYEELRRKQSSSRIYARHRNPNMYVRWARDDSNDIALHKHLGFVFAKDNPKGPEDKRRIDTVVQLGEDGMYRIGDVILMEIPRDDYEFYCNENAQRSRELVDAGKRSFRDEAEKLGVETFERNPRTGALPRS